MEGNSRGQFKARHDWSDLHDLYIRKGLTIKQIAQIKGCAEATVHGHLVKQGIPRRSKLIGFERTTHAKGPANPNWKGGRRTDYQGYVLVNMPAHPYANRNGWIMEHRLVMERKLGRYLLPSEKVHHINGIRDDNRPENLELLSPQEHSIRTRVCQNCRLYQEVRLLRWQIKELVGQLHGSKCVETIHPASHVDEEIVQS